REQMALRARSGTRPGTLLKHQIPIRTFSEWNEVQPGLVEIDLVGHEGGSSGGDSCQTLDVTEVASGWTEAQAVLNQAEVWVFEALKDIRARLPFVLRGVDSDNGSEFINHHLLRYCEHERITFTRGRAVGYARYEGAGQLTLLNRLYGRLRLYTNYFQHVMKLTSKERHGAMVKKTYDRAPTPYQRLLRAPTIPAEARQRLRVEYDPLNPAALKRAIDTLQRLLHLLEIV
ncbi:Integrase catalytic region, partial [mine drainage metagenome]